MPKDHIGLSGCWGAILVSCPSAVCQHGGVGVGVLLLLGSWGWARRTRALPRRRWCASTSRKAPELALVDQSGQPLTLTEFRGKVVLLTFTYSACAEVCPLITAAMVTLQQRLTAAERQQVFFLSVTAQPEVDTPAVLYAYANHLGVDLASWAFVTGPPQAVQAVWQAFGLTVKRRAKGWWIIPPGHF